MSWLRTFGASPFLAALLAAAVVLGCAPRTVIVDKPPDRTQGNLIKIGIAYGRYCSEKQKAPQTANDIQRQLNELGDPSELLRSPRDGQPLVICWGTNILQPAAWAKSTPVLAYEQQGDDGTRYVLTTLRSVEQLSSEQFHAASFPPGHKPPP